MDIHDSIRSNNHHKQHDHHHIMSGSSGSISGGMPEFLIHSIEFFHEFLYNFLFPTILLIFSSIALIAIIHRIYRSYFARYATIEEMYDESLRLLTKNSYTTNANATTNSNNEGDIISSLEMKENSNMRRRHRTRGGGGGVRFMNDNDNDNGLLGSKYYKYKRTNVRRKKALDLLRLIIQLSPQSSSSSSPLLSASSNDENNNKKDGIIKNNQTNVDIFMKARILLATELFYGELNGHIDPSPPPSSSLSSTSSSCRQSSPLEECQILLRDGLRMEPNNPTLLKLQSELNVVLKYGKSDIHAKMMNVGSFGWNLS